MALKEEQGLGNWEIATAKKLVSENRRKHRILEREEFEDLMQECLAHWIVARRRIPPEPDPRPPVSYMAQVLRNKLTDRVREMTAGRCPRRSWNFRRRFPPVSSRESSLPT